MLIDSSEILKFENVKWWNFYLSILLFIFIWYIDESEKENITQQKFEVYYLFNLILVIQNSFYFEFFEKEEGLGWS